MKRAEGYLECFIGSIIKIILEISGIIEVRVDHKTIHHQWAGKGMDLLTPDEKTGRYIVMMWVGVKPIPPDCKLLAFIRINGIIITSADKAEIFSNGGYSTGDNRILNISFRTPFMRDDDIEIEIVSYDSLNGIDRALKIIKGEENG